MVVKGVPTHMFQTFHDLRNPFVNSTPFDETFLAPTNSFKQDILQCHDASILMAIPLIFSSFWKYFCRILGQSVTC
jgi:hypothetical protein